MKISISNVLVRDKQKAVTFSLYLFTQRVFVESYLCAGHCASSHILDKAVSRPLSPASHCPSGACLQGGKSRHSQIIRHSGNCGMCYIYTGALETLAKSVLFAAIGASFLCANILRLGVLSLVQRDGRRLALPPKKACVPKSLLM